MLSGIERSDCSPARSSVNKSLVFIYSLSSLAGSSHMEVREDAAVDDAQ